MVHSCPYTELPTKAVAKATDLDYESEEASDESDADAPLSLGDGERGVK